MHLQTVEHRLGRRLIRSMVGHSLLDKPLSEAVPDIVIHRNHLGSPNAGPRLRIQMVRTTESS